MSLVVRSSGAPVSSPSERRGRPGCEAGRICNWQRTTPRPATAGRYAGIGPAPPASAWAISSLFLDPILRLRRHDPTDAAPGIGNVARPPWDDVNVGVHQRLPRCRPVVDADVEPIGL